MSGHRDRLDVVNAETLLMKAELRTKLLTEAQELVPEAIRQAKKGKPALLRLISGMVFRNVAQDAPRPKK